MRNSTNDTVHHAHSTVVYEFNTIFSKCNIFISNPIMNQSLNPITLQLVDDIDNLAVPHIRNILLEGQTEHQNPRAHLTRFQLFTELIQ